MAGLVKLRRSAEGGYGVLLWADRVEPAYAASATFAIITMGG
jgi:hypothetical protein